MIKQLDIVKLITTKNVKYLNGPPNNPAKPNGNWTVVGTINGELLLSKDLTIIKIPGNDVIKIGNYQIPKLENKNGEEKE